MNVSEYDCYWYAVGNGWHTLCEDIVYSERMVNFRNSANTDGLIVKLHGNEQEVRDICSEWEHRTGMGLGYDKITKICQKDVNNYIIVFDDGKIDSKGAYVKPLNDLDYDLPIVNEAVTDYLLRDIPVENTVMLCNDFRKFPKVVKLSAKYQWVEHEQLGGTVRYDNKAYRVIAQISASDGRLIKCKVTENGDKKDKFANTPDHCFIYNDEIIGKEVPRNLNKGYYVDLAYKRLKDFGVAL